ncbi:MAG: tetratricopeptide repeat protein [Wenzhouxiangella sp.]
MSTPEFLMGEIRQHLQNSRYAEASTACRQALAVAPENAELRMLMGLCEEAAGRADSARAWMEKALEKAPEHAAAAMHFGRLLMSEGRDEEARQALDRCLTIDPNDAAARTLLARIAQRAGDRAGAIEGLRTALLADPNYAPAHAGLAALLLRRGELEPAHQHAAMAVRLRPEDALTQITMAQVLQAQGHFDFAEQCLRNAVEARPDHMGLRAALEQLQRVRSADLNGGEADQPEQQLQRMRTHYRQGRLLAAAELADLLQFRFAAEDPVMLELAEVLMDAGQLEAADDVLERSDDSLPRHALTRARLSAVRGELSTAQQQLAALFDDQRPDLRHDARRLSADLHLREQRLDEALEVLRPLADESEVPPASMRLLAQLEHAGGETATARDLLGRLLERPALSEAEQAVSHNLLGRILDESGAYAAAGRHLVRGAWRPPFLVDELLETSPDALHQAWSERHTWPFPDQPLDDGRQAPMFVSGWPGSGREALMPVLLSAAGLELLPTDELDRRRQILRLPADPAVLAACSDADLRLSRKRYLRGVRPDRGGVLEPGQLPVTAIPAVARLFPDATLLWLKASELALKLHWRLAGCREVDRMLEVWRQEQDLYAHMANWLPLRRVELELDDLLTGDSETLTRLAAALGLKDSQALAGALAASFRQAGYRPAGHWRHYAELI